MAPRRQRTWVSSRGFSTEQTTSDGEKSETGEERGEKEDPTEAAKEDAADPRDTEIAELKQKLADAQKAVKEADERVMRTMADMENTRKIARTDVDNARKFGVQSFGKSLLEVADNFELALGAIKELAEAGTNVELSNFYTGVEMTQKTLGKALEKQGIERFESLGEKFDPNIHDGLFQYEDPKKEPGTVGQVLKQGYKLKDRVLRPAQVGTVKKTTAPPASEDSG